MIPCQQDQTFEMIRDSLHEIKADLKEVKQEVSELKSFKIKVTAVATVISTIVVGTIQFIWSITK